MIKAVQNFCTLTSIRFLIDEAQREASPFYSLIINNFIIRLRQNIASEVAENDRT